ncbi:hypothetical protein [Aquimarina mytili]|uniref:Uncharacterized protein n=1 Tax=Aquimarina mytili TaxID=874423 RepID=A0A936ZQ90_9FLAO|nr:hypothetical protein [Aquimarina mytili]MBL0683432.1 hypothetical protein [Aquimarina mytili]
MQSQEENNRKMILNRRNIKTLGILIQDYKKNILLYILLIVTLHLAKAQIVINVPGYFTDFASQSSYVALNTSNTIMSTQVATQSGIAGSMSTVFDNQNDELSSINFYLKLRKNGIKKFISGPGFNRPLGYTSYGYIEKRYPIINLTSPSDVFRNTRIRWRYRKKLFAESQKVDHYLNRRNPIPEGERVLLVLTALENVINITLENETY